jgi:hypothetical protein
VLKKESKSNAVSTRTEWQSRRKTEGHPQQDRRSQLRHSSTARPKRSRARQSSLAKAGDLSKRSAEEQDGARPTSRMGSAISCVDR